MAALNTLRREGIERVRIERLAADLGVTKGSFYWHFRDRQDLLDRLIEYWFREMTETVFALARRFEGNPRERLEAVLADITGRERARYDIAVRAWAQADKKAARAVRDVDERRLEFLEALLRDLGIAGAEAESRARMLYYYMLGEATAFNRQSRRQRIEAVSRAVEVHVCARG